MAITKEHENGSVATTGEARVADKMDNKRDKMRRHTDTVVKKVLTDDAVKHYSTSYRPLTMDDRSFSTKELPYTRSL